LSRDIVSKYEAYFEATLLCKKESLNAGTNCQQIQDLYAVAPKLMDMIVRPLSIGSWY